MNKKAFTLIELLAVIIILGILSTIVVVSVDSYIRTARETSFDTLVNSIELSTELYVADHSNDFPQLDTPGSTFYISLGDLVAADYINSNLIDERTGDRIPLTTQISITVLTKNKIEVHFTLQ